MTKYQNQQLTIILVQECESPIVQMRGIPLQLTVA